MKYARIVTPLLLSLTIVAAAVFPAPDSHAQEPTQTAVLRVTDFEIDEVRSPQYSLDRGTSRVGDEELEWLRLTLMYETEGGENGWIDTLQLNWYVLLLEGATPRLLMKTSVSYLDISSEIDEHRAVVYVRPRAIRRYYNEDGDIDERNVVVHVEAVVGGRMIAEYSYLETRARIPERWWTFGAPQVRPLNNALLSRDKTPFAPLEYDRYEYIKPESR